MKLFLHFIRFRFKRLKPILPICLFPLALILVFLFVSCQTDRPTISLDEARKISVQFSDVSFEPPPRSIADLRTIIDDYLFKKEIPPCIQSRPRSSLSAISESLKEAPAFPQYGHKVRILEDMAKSELNNGNYSRCITLQKMAIAELPVKSIVKRGNLLATLSKYYAYGGDFKSANNALNSALNWYNQSNYNNDWKRYYQYSGKALIEQMQGNLLRAEQHFNEALVACGKVRGAGGYEGYSLKVDLAENLMFQGRLLEAEILTREVVSYFKNREGSYTEGKALLILSIILFEQGRYIEAEHTALAAINKYLLIGTDCSSIFLNLARKTAARSLMAQERWEGAVSQFDAIQEGMKDDPEAFEARFAGDVDWALVLFKTGQVSTAANILRTGLDRTIKRLGEKHYHTAEIRGLIAMTNAAEGRQEIALEGFMGAVSNLLARSNQASVETVTRTAKNQRLSLILEGYIRLLSDIHGTQLEAKSEINAADVAFSLADVARNRSVKRAVDAHSARYAVKNLELADLTRREQDAEKQINALYGTLAKAVSQRFSDQDQEVIQSLRDKIDTLSDARLAIVKEIESRFPKYAELINPSPLSLEKARAALVPGESLISIYIGRDRSYIWAIPYQGEVAFVSAPLGRKDVEEMVEKVRYALIPNAKTLGKIPEFDLDSAYAIYQAFLKPVREGWENAKSLLIVPHGALGYLPLSLIPTKPIKLAAKKKALFSNYQEVPWLVRSHAVTVLPSVSSLMSLRALPTSYLVRRTFVGFGDPYFSEQQAKAAAKNKAKVQFVVTQNRDDYNLRGISIERVKTDQLDSAELALLPRLPETADEIRSIALALKADITKDVFTGAQANEYQVKNMDLSAYKIVAFATHGLAPGDLNGLLQPALALSSPKVSGTEGDGLLTMSEILGLRLNADWVILSACNTGAGKEDGAEALSGLARAFFYAGARALLVSNWPVETTSAKALTTDLFKRQAANPTLNRAEALRQSMLSLIDGEGYVDQTTGKVMFSYAHPIFWASFTLVGDCLNTSALN